jgi:osmoprotectant transport system permease protein
MSGLRMDDSSSPLATWSYFMDNRSQDLGWLWTHAWLSALPVVVGLLLALPLGWVAHRYKFSYPPIMSISGLLYTIPSIALFILIPPILHLDPLTIWQVPIALSLYSLALLVRVVADGLGSVSTETVQAATALGFTGSRRFFTVELPNAIPVITAGLRVALVSNVSIVAVAGTIGLQNLGSLFEVGYQQSTTGPYYPPIVLGLILCLLLALCLDLLVVFAGRILTPWRRAVR